MTAFTNKVYSLNKEIIEEIKNLMIKHQCTEIDLEEANDPTDVIWYDKDGYPNESRVEKVCLDSQGELSLIVSGEYSHITLYEGTDFAFQVPNWLASIYDSVEQLIHTENK